MKVRIEGGGRTVEIDTDAKITPKTLAAIALDTWRATDNTRPPGDGPAYGFQSERRTHPPSSTMRRPPPVPW